MIVVTVSGTSSEVGKTGLMCALLGRLSGWAAVKVTRGHYRSCGRDPETCCVSHLLGDRPRVFADRAVTAGAPSSQGAAGVFVVGSDGSVQHEGTDHSAAMERYKRTREKLKQLLIDGQLESREVEVEVTQHGPMFDMMVPQGAPEGGIQ